MLHVNTGLVSLNLSKNQVGDFGAKLLSEYLAINTTLKILNLRWCVSFVSKSDQVASRGCLSCSNSISGVGGEALASLLLRGFPLEELNLDSNRIGDLGGVAFGLVLRRCPSLLACVAVCILRNVWKSALMCLVVAQVGSPAE